MGHDKRYNIDLPGVTEERRKRMRQKQYLNTKIFLRNESHATNSRDARNPKQNKYKENHSQVLIEKSLKLRSRNPYFQR